MVYWYSKKILTHDRHSSLTSGVLLVFILCIAVLVLGLHLLLHPRHLGAGLQLLVVAGEGSSLVFDHRGRGHILGWCFTSEILNFQIIWPRPLKYHTIYLNLILNID